jgi:hypothetical protein
VTALTPDIRDRALSTLFLLQSIAVVAALCLIRSAPRVRSGSTPAGATT